MAAGTDRTGQRADPLRRARRSFWVAVVVAMLAAGWLSSALSAGPSPMTGLQVATSGLMLLIAVMLAARLMTAIDRARRSSLVYRSTKE